MATRVAIGIITYKESTAKYLPYFLTSLNEQTYRDYKLFVYDNTDDGSKANQEALAGSSCEMMGDDKNIGYGAAYNSMIRRAIEQKFEYFFVVNPDTVLDSNCLSVMIDELDKNSELSCVSPKIYQWQFEGDKKTNILDTCGIVMSPALQFSDLGQGEVDSGQYDNAEILGPSGAAGLFRLSSLESIKEGEQYFDEHFFMYKEDCDLVLRLSLAKYAAKIALNAKVFHDRTASSKGLSLFARIKNRRTKSRRVNEWSFVNQQIIYYKYWRTLTIGEKLTLMKQQVIMLVYILLFEQCLLLSLGALARNRKGVKFYE